MYKTINPVAWSTIWSFVIPVPMLFLLPVPSSAIAAYMLAAMATGATVLFHEFVRMKPTSNSAELGGVLFGVN
jgi:hypothetical protein